MGDSRSPQIFGPIFEDILLYVPPGDREYLARKYWRMSQDYDFAPCELDVDNALIDLGLARRVVHPTDGYVMHYASPTGVLPSEGQGDDT
jgi:hypothetical protein